MSVHFFDRNRDLAERTVYVEAYLRKEITQVLLANHRDGWAAWESHTREVSTPPRQVPQSNTLLKVPNKTASYNMTIFILLNDVVLSSTFQEKKILWTRVCIIASECLRQLQSNPTVEQENNVSSCTILSTSSQFWMKTEKQQHCYK